MTMLTAITPEQAEVAYNAAFRQRLPDILRTRPLQQWCDGIDAMWRKMAEIKPQREIAAILEQSAQTVHVFYERRADPTITDDPANITTCVYSPGYGHSWHRLSFYPVWSVVRGERAHMWRVVRGSYQALEPDEIAQFEVLVDQQPVTSMAA